MSRSANDEVQQTTKPFLLRYNFTCSNADKVFHKRKNIINFDVCLSEEHLSVAEHKALH